MNSNKYIYVELTFIPDLFYNMFYLLQHLEILAHFKNV